MFFLCSALKRFIKNSWGNFRKEWNKEMLQVVVIISRIMQTWLQHFTACSLCLTCLSLSLSCGPAWWPWSPWCRSWSRAPAGSNESPGGSPASGATPSDLKRGKFLLCLVLCYSTNMSVHISCLIKLWLARFVWGLYCKPKLISVTHIERLLIVWPIMLLSVVRSWFSHPWPKRKTSSYFFRQYFKWLLSTFSPTLMFDIQQQQHGGGGTKYQIKLFFGPGNYCEFLHKHFWLSLSF